MTPLVYEIVASLYVAALAVIAVIIILWVIQLTRNDE